MVVLDERKYVKILEDIIAKQKQTIDELTKISEAQSTRIAELERRLNMNSSNSSKPPSSDGLKKKSRSLRKPSGKKPGGQHGHKGTTLRLPCSPGEKITCKPEECTSCDRSAQCQGKAIESRFVIDVQINPVVREFVQMAYRCPKADGWLLGEFPSGITATKQYGNALRALVVSLNAECAVSVNKIHNLLNSILHLPVSTGFIHRAVTSFAGKQDSALDSIQSNLLQLPVVNADETGMRAEEGTAWLHNVSTDQWTYQYASKKRGKAGMAEAGFLPEYKGIVVHDCWPSYWAFPVAGHGLCLAHILRELQGILDNVPEQEWARNITELLVRMKEVKEKLLSKGKTEASYYYRRLFLDEWNRQICAGQAQNPIAEHEKRKKKNRARRLLDRLEAHTEEFLLFFHDFRVPFDNNQAERDVRQIKVKIKVAGCFRTLAGAQAYAKIHSVISTIKKHGLNVYESIKAMLQQPSLIPWELAGRVDRIGFLRLPLTEPNVRFSRIRLLESSSIPDIY